MLTETIPNLLSALDEAMGDDFSQPACLIRFETRANDVDFGLKPLAAGQHPLDALWGFVAPDEWAALGVACHGWGASLRNDCRPSKAPDRVRLRTIHVITREGDEIGGFRRQDEAFEFKPESPIGMVPDALRRCLGLPTPLPDFPAAELTAADWMDAIADDRSAVTAPPVPYRNWAEPRWEVITRSRVVRDLSPTIATWMDEGLFARWMRSTYPRTSDQLAGMRRILDIRRYDVVKKTIVSWGITD